MSLRVIVAITLVAVPCMNSCAWLRTHYFQACKAIKWNGCLVATLLCVQAALSAPTWTKQLNNMKVHELEPATEFRI